jgi:hypothetical protein
MNILEKIKSFFKKETTAEESFPPLVCDFCGRTRKKEERYWDINSPYYGKYWMGINDKHECPQCREKKMAEKPHCETCHCAGKVRKDK